GGDDRDCPVGSSGSRLREDDGRKGAVSHRARHRQRHRSEYASALIDRELTAGQKGEVREQGVESERRRHSSCRTSVRETKGILRNRCDQDLRLESRSTGSAHPYAEGEL